MPDFVVPSGPEGGDDDGTGFDSTGRIVTSSYQRANAAGFGEVLRAFLKRAKAKAMVAWYAPSQGYDSAGVPVTEDYTPVAWIGAHWRSNDGLSNHKHISIEVPDSTGALQTRLEIIFGDPDEDDQVAGLDKTRILTNQADLVVRCTNGQQLRLAAPAGQDITLEFSHDAHGDPSYRRWKIRTTSELENGGNTGSNFQIVRYGDDGVLIDQPFTIERSTGRVTIRNAVRLINVTTPPTAAGPLLYAEGGALKFRGANGTVTTLAPA